MNKLAFFSSNKLFFAGLLLLVLGMPVSLFLTSLSQFVLAISFFTEGNFIEKFKKFFSNRPAVLLAAIWFMHVIGLLWTNDLAEGFKDVRIKLPLLVLPVIIAGSRPLPHNQFRFILLSFVFAVFCGTVVSMGVLTGIVPREINDIRDVFIFHISHIRFSLFTCLAIFILMHLTFFEKQEIKMQYKILAILFATWFLIFLLIVESVTGIVVFSITGFMLLIYHAFTKANRRNRILMISTTIIIPLVAILFIRNFIRDFYIHHPVKIDVTEKTSMGNEYYFNLDNPLYENGYPVWVYVCEDELRTAWNERSTFKFDSLDHRNQELKFTLVRFLASKGLRKDASGVRQLTEKEVGLIEQGVANIAYSEMSNIRARLTQIVWEFDQLIHGGNPSGHSVTQRMEFWKAGWQIAKTHLLTGVGTGDMPASYKMQYDFMDSPLDEAHRLRAHNQFLAILVAFGLPGLLFFLLAFFYPMYAKNTHIGFLFGTFLIVATLSMVTEDTLETQAGATFIGLFYPLLLFGKEKPRDMLNENR